MRRCPPERPWEEGSSPSPGACEDELDGVLGGLGTSLTPWQVPNCCLATAGERAAGEHFGVSLDSIFSAQMQFGNKSNKPAYPSAAVSPDTGNRPAASSPETPQGWGAGGREGAWEEPVTPSTGHRASRLCPAAHAADGVTPPQRNRRGPLASPQGDKGRARLQPGYLPVASSPLPLDKGRICPCPGWGAQSPDRHPVTSCGPASRGTRSFLSTCLGDHVLSRPQGPLTLAVAPCSASSRGQQVLGAGQTLCAKQRPGKRWGQGSPLRPGPERALGVQRRQETLSTERPPTSCP